MGIGSFINKTSFILIPVSLRLSLLPFKDFLNPAKLVLNLALNIGILIFHLQVLEAVLILLIGLPHGIEIAQSLGWSMSTQNLSFIWAVIRNHLSFEGFIAPVNR